MAIRYFIYQTTLGARTRYVGRVLSPNTFDTAALIERMVARGTSMTKVDILAVLSLMKDTVQLLCREGARVNLDGLVRFSPVITGTFEGRLDKVTPGRNDVRIQVSAAEQLGPRLFLGVPLRRAVRFPGGPQIEQLVDLDADQSPFLLRTGHLVELRGSGLGFDARRGDWIRLLDSTNPSNWVGLPVLGQIGRRRLLVRVPPCEFSKAFVEFASCSRSKDPRTVLSGPWGFGRD